MKLELQKGIVLSLRDGLAPPTLANLGLALAANQAASKTLELPVAALGPVVLLLSEHAAASRAAAVSARVCTWFRAIQRVASSAAPWGDFVLLRVAGGADVGLGSEAVWF